MKKTFITKDGKNYIIELKEYDDYYGITAYNDKNESIGYCNFSINKRTCWLYKIEITNKNYLAKGIGKTMLKVMENFVKPYANSIEGKFYPEGIGAERAMLFYKKNGYSIDKEDYEQMIFKFISNDMHKNEDESFLLK